MNDRLPVTIITGFLGSGKTTLLNHILHNLNELKVAILVNEFGDINIDSQLLVTMDEDMVELTNGCICCTLNEGLLNTMHKILEQRDRLDAIIIETTGLADPLPIALTLLGTELRDMTTVDSILTVIDAENFETSLLSSEVLFQQVTYGDIILVNKTDLVSSEQLESIDRQIEEIKDCARILRMQNGNIPLPLILDIQLGDTGTYHQASQDDIRVSHVKNDGYVSVSFKSKRPFDLKKFQEFLDYQLPANVFRMKGILWFQESHAQHIFQLSGKRFQIDDRSWETEPNNQLVCIGQKINPLQLQQMLTNCLTYG
jgi:G3E family GTPase